MKTLEKSLEDFEEGCRNYGLNTGDLNQSGRRDVGNVLSQATEKFQLELMGLDQDPVTERREERA